MPDITMCNSLKCTLRETCYRHKAIPKEMRQSYFANPPHDGKGNCEHYVKIKPHWHEVQE